MPRTKATEAPDKTRRAEEIRRRHLEQHDPEFQRELTELKAIAKRLADAPSGRFHVLSEMSEKDLLPTADEIAFCDLAERFKKKWNFQPRWDDDGRVTLDIIMPAGGYEMDLESGVVIERTRRGKYHPDGDVDALAKYYRSLRQRLCEKREKEKGKPSPQRRKRIDTDEQRLKARELSAQGKTVTQIAKALFPHKYQKALQDILDPRPASVKLQKLTNRVRYLLKL